jgi:pimeloyl-ACP methyl ester carboxylesterase
MREDRPDMTTAVFVHGNPETSAIWGPLIEALHRTEVETLSPPGFGAPVPPGFEATSDDYEEWLIEQLEDRDRPVDLVGHDWGGGHVIRTAIARPDLIRSWAIDIAGCFAPDYEWHDVAQVWQTPGAGEQAVDEMVAMPVAERAALYESLGMTKAAAFQVAGAIDATMGRCILALYRSAIQPAMVRIGGQLPAAAARPGLVLIPTEDIYTGGTERARWAADQARAKVAVLNGLGHWWMLEDPEAGARTLEQFWAGLT